MTILVARASAVLATIGTTWSATANAVDGAYGSEPGTFALWTNTTANAVGGIELGFGSQISSAVGAGDAVNAVAVAVQHKVSNVTRVPTITVQCYDGATPIGTAQNATADTVTHRDDFLFTVTNAQLRSPNFKVVVKATRFNGTTAGTFSIDHADIAVNYGTISAAETLTDDFASQIDPLKWPERYGTVAWSAGRAALTELNADYSGISSAMVYDLTNSFVYCNPTVPPAQNAYTETTLGVYGPDLDNGLFFGLFLESGVQKMFLREVNAAASDQIIGVYDPATMAYIRIRRDGSGNAYWDTSPDGVTWTNQRTKATSLSPIVKVDISVGQWASATPRGIGYLDNVNVKDVVRSSQDALALADSASVVLTAAKPKAATLADDFGGDLSKWPATYGGVVIQGGRAKIPCTAAYPAMWTTPDLYDLAGSAIFAQVTPPAPGTNREFSLEVRLDNANKAILLHADGYLYLRTYTAGTGTTWASVPYDPVAHAWWKVHSAGPGDVRWSTSPDGATWTEQASTTVTWSMAATELLFMAGWWGGGSDDVAYVDNVNLLPAAPILLDRSDAEGLADAQTDVVGLARADLVGLSDAMAAAADVSLALSDLAPLTDSVATARGIVLDRSDAEGVTDAQGSGLLAARAVADPVNLSDAGFAATGLARSDPVGLTDSEAAAVGLARADSANLTDAVAAAKSSAITLSATDSANLADSQASSVTAARADIEGLTDSAASAAVRVAALADLVPLTDSTAVVAGFGLDRSDSGGVTDSQTSDQGTGRADALGLTDAVDAAKSSAGALSVTDPVSPSDAWSVATAWARSDSLGLADSRAISADRTQADLAALTDASSYALSRGYATTDPEALTDYESSDLLSARVDDAGLTDSFVGTKSSAGQYATSDPLDLTDAVTSSAAAVRAFSDPQNLTDGVAAAITIGKNLADLAALTDAAAATLALARDYVDAASPTDAGTGTLQAVRTLIDVQTLADAASTALLASAVYVDGLTVTDVVTSDLTRGWGFVDPLTVTDVVETSRTHVGYVIPRPDTGRTARPNGGRTARPDTGRTARPDTGRTIRVNLGTTTRPREYEHA